MITMYAAVFNKSLSDGHFGLMAQNAIRSWQALDPAPEILILGRAEEIAADCERLGVRFVPVPCGEDGVPLADDIQKVANAAASYPVRMLTCADQIYFDDLYGAVRHVQQCLKTFLLIGRRYELDIQQPLDFTNGAHETLMQEARKANNLTHGVVVSYLIHNEALWPEMPPFRMDGGVMDNWMVWTAMRKGVPVIDITGLATVIHQKHGRLPSPPPPPFTYNIGLLPDEFFYAGVHTASFITHRYQVNPQTVTAANEKHSGIMDALSRSAHPVFGWGASVMVTGENL